MTTILQELIGLIQEIGGRPKEEYTSQRDAAYARAKWHKAQAQKHKGKDDDVAKAHDEAEMDWINISQEWTHKNPTIAQRTEARANEKLSKSQTARRETDEKYPK